MDSRYTFRTLSAEDIPAGLRLSRASGWNQSEDDWRVFADFPGGGGFLAEKAGQVIGTVAFLRYGSVAWIAMMLVDPQERRAGIGTQLMNQALCALKDIRCVGLDATPAGELLYRRFGFVTDSHLVRTKTTIETSRFGTSVLPASRMTSADLAGVLRRDRDVFGGDRGQLLTWLFKRAPECAWIVNESADLRGYCFGRPGSLYHQLGPIVAEDAGTASSLVTHCCLQMEGRRVAIDATRLDADWLAWLTSVGFLEERTFVRMFRQGDAPPGIPARQYAVTGPEFA